MSGWYGRAVPGGLRGLLQRGAMGGLLVARHNFDGTRESLAALCASLASTAPADAQPLIAADEEGGPVAHLSPPLTSFPSMTSLGAIDDTALTRRVGAAMGTELRGVGVNMDLAPVLDVRTSRQNMVVLGRVFGRDADTVSRHGRALIEGLRSAGTIPCAKHFPGHGDTADDSHQTLPRVPHALARLDAVELVPYRACLARLPAIMLAHVVYEGVDRTVPASLSRPVIEGVMREHLGFTGVAMSDDLQMAAIRATWPIEQACETSMRAGCDLLLVAHNSAYAVAAVRHMAQLAMDDTAFRDRLGIAAGRIRALRTMVPTAAQAPVATSEGPALAREAARRFAAVHDVRRGATTARDPTLRR
jgi:beta-N-acetylhexosaminidase